MRSVGLCASLVFTLALLVSSWWTPSFGEIEVVFPLQSEVPFPWGDDVPFPWGYDPNTAASFAETGSCPYALEAKKNTQANKVEVSGYVLVHGEKDKVNFLKAVPQGFNPAILVLKLSVEETKSPKKGRAVRFNYTENGKETNNYKQAQVDAIAYGKQQTCLVDLKVH